MSLQKFIIALSIILAGCQVSSPEHIESAEDVKGISSDERRLWHVADEFDETLELGNYIYHDPDLQQYVQSVMDKLYPEYIGAIRVLIINSPDLNAFALPNGSIYINSGMLSRLDNEAQMATVLAHEGVHFVNKHSYQQRKSLKQTSAISLGVGMAAGIPSLGSIITISSIYGYSQNLEREADRDGFKRLQRAGYDVSESSKAFKHLLAEVEALDIKQPYFFSSHPRLEERIDSFTKLATQVSQTSRYKGEETYHDHMKDLKLVLLDDYLEIGQYKSVLLILTNEYTRNKYPPEASYYLGEAYRLRNKKGDIEKSIKAYKDSIQVNPDFSQAYRSLGMQYMKKNDSKNAIEYFNKYLVLAPDAPDVGYIENYISKLQSQRVK
jgi:predicted Zn-dependent protease